MMHGERVIETLKTPPDGACPKGIGEAGRSRRSAGIRTALRVFVLVLVVLPALSVHAVAGAIVVNDLTDTAHPVGCAVTGTGTCSLQDAINFANANVGADVVTFSASGTITLSATLPAIDDTLTIDGSGQTVTISGNMMVRVMNVNANKTLNLNAVTIADALSVPVGGINNSGTLNVTNCTFTGNSSFTSVGGAIGTVGPTTITNSTFFNNIGSLNAGAILVQGNTTTITNCTFFNNAGAILLIGAGSAIITNSIFAANTQFGSQNCAVFMGNTGTLTDGGHNIDDGTTCLFTGPTCPTTTGSSKCSTNPLLDPDGLQTNGGSTKTLALCTAVDTPTMGCTGASPAINMGDQSVCAMAPVSNLDQRGFLRPGGAAMNCSIGAFDAAAGPPPVGTSTATRTSPATVTRTASATRTSTATATVTTTPTSTATRTASSTRTGTNTATATRTATNTRTQTSTATSTATRTATRTATETRTPTATLTPTTTPSPQPNGALCGGSGQCTSTFCVDGVCCDTACDSPGESCSVTGNRGTCTTVSSAAAPAMSEWSLIATAILLLGAGVAVLVRTGSRR
jgi:hypothetical protein